ncbi:ABC transporter permease [Psychrobacillus sp. MER TA 171]|uniref:ABC transporter permease n=1 Tax=Psychrobacillus sp. MER TA 171 TaxID=2939577 RepID=UPI00204129D1|nr:ABC transporter permease [Psychrobacillus sp. MER TA 171]MCM3357615.1 ABC transporter permease [Psychrobacillus sp. MER TA 171]
MLFNLISKQLKVIVRNKQPLIILLAMPIILITILSSALAGIMDTDGSSAIQAHLVIIDETSWEKEQASITVFLKESGLEGSTLNTLLQTFEENDPTNVLQNSILLSKEMEKYVKTTNEDISNLEDLRKSDNVDGILVIPDNFRLDYIKQSYFDQGNKPSFELLLNQENEIRSSIIASILEEWKKGYSQSMALNKVGITPNEVMGQTIAVQKLEHLMNEGERTIPSSVYYSVGMLVMFALYIPSFLAGFALQEVYWKVYDRILLAGVSSTYYTLSIFITGAIVALLQQAIILLYGSLVLGIDWIGIQAMIVIVISFSLFIGGLSALLTALQFKTGTEGIANVFNGLVITIFSFLGGSFFKISDVSETLGDIGGYTPNGATMKAILSIQTGDSVGVIWPQMYVLYIGLLLCVSLSIIVFPKRGVTS